MAPVPGPSGGTLRRRLAPLLALLAFAAAPTHAADVLLVDDDRAGTDVRSADTRALDAPGVDYTVFDTRNEPGTSPSAARHPDLAPMLAAARERGTVPVIIELAAGAAAAANRRSPADAALRRREALDAARARVVARLAGRRPPGTQRRMRSYRWLPLLAAELDEEDLLMVTAHPDVVAVREDRLRALVLAESVPQVGADLAAAAGFGGAGQVVAVLDTGVDSDHPFLAGKVVHQARFSTESGALRASTLCPNGEPEQVGGGSGEPCTITACGHGTHVAGIVAGSDGAFDGVAPDADIMSVQVFTRFDGEACSAFGMASPCLLSFDSDIIAGLEHVHEQLATFPVAAVNLSLGGGRFTEACDQEPTHAAIELLAEAGVATVVAAGNEGYTDAITSPGCVGAAISVGAVSKDDAIVDFSNTAPILDLLAPGVGINSSVPGGGYAFVSGTSMSTAHVSGAIAALRSRLPTARVDQLLSALRASGVPLFDTRNALTVPRISVLDAVDALGAAAGTGALEVTPPGVLAAAGGAGGPFEPASADFLVANTGGDPVSYAMTTSVPWVAATPAAGVLDPGESVTVTVSLAAAAESLPVGDHAATVRFDNLTNGLGATVRAVTLSVVTPYALNDKFADAFRIDTSAGATTVTSDGAGKEPGEPDHAGKAGGASVWWHWTAPGDGTVTFDTLQTGFDTLLAAYTGSSVSALTEVASNDDEIGAQSRIVFAAEAGITYRVAADGVAGVTGNVTLRWSFDGGPTPAPDIAITPSAPVVIEGPEGGPFSLDVLAYTITNVSPELQDFDIFGIPDWLTPSTTHCCVEPNSSLLVTFTVNEAAASLPPGTYHTHLDFDEVEREVTLHVTQPAPPNDTFAQAAVLAPEGAELKANNVGAGKEPGEPAHAGNPGGASLWWRWTPATDTHVIVDTRGSVIDTTLAVYTGAAVDALTEVASNDDAAGSSASEVAFDASAGVTYHVAVDGFNGEAGALGLRLESGVLRVPLDVPDIETATAASGAGDTIRLAEGTYATPVVLDKLLHLSGGWNASFTTQPGVSVIDGEQVRPGVDLVAGGTLERLRVLNGVPGIRIGGAARVLETEVRGSFESGIVITATGVTVDIERSAVVGNTTRDPDGWCSSAHHAGGIDVRGTAALRLTNSTVSGNVGCNGGAIWAASAEISHSTVSDNEALPSTPGTTGGVRAEALLLRNSIVSGNRGYGTGAQCAGSITSEGVNIGSGCGDSVDVDPLLCPLGDYGGTTPGHGLRPGSPAIDGSPAGTCVGPDFGPLGEDQRGEPRPLGAACEIGAFEGIVAGGTALESREWAPLPPGRWWNYQVEGGPAFTSYVMPGTVNVNGAMTTRVYHNVLRDSDYYTNDCLGLRLHRQDVYDPGLSVTDSYVFSPAMPLLDATPVLGERVESNGTVHATLPGLGNFTLSYESSSEVEAFEPVSVAAGEFDALRFRTTVRVYGAFGIDETEVNTTWLARDVGIVKETVDSGFEFSSVELTSRAPELVSPARGSMLPGATAAFTWEDNGTVANAWGLWLGTAPGKSDIASVSTVSAEDRSVTVDTLPSEGGAVYARLWFRVGGTWLYVDDQYVAASLPLPSMTGPTPGLALSTANQRFSWSANGTAVQQWRLQVGTRHGGGDLFDQYFAADAHSVRVAELLTHGEPLHVRLAWLARGVWRAVDSEYTAVTLPDPELVSHGEGSVLSGASASFTWDDHGVPVQDHAVWFGTAPGGLQYGYAWASEVDAQHPETVPALTFSDLPFKGEPVHVTFWWKVRGTWFNRAYTMTATTLEDPELTLPADGSGLAAPSATFTWDDNEMPVEDHAIWFGSMPGGRDHGFVWAQNATATELVFDRLPLIAQVVHATFYWKVRGVWFSRPYTFTTGGAPLPALSSVDVVGGLFGSGGVFTGASATFSWDDAGLAVQDHAIWFGSTPRGLQYGFSWARSDSAEPLTFTKLPYKGQAVHVTFWWKVNGVWSNRAYLLEAATLADPELTAPEDPTDGDSVITTGEQLPGASADFAWDDHGVPVEDHAVWFGTAAGGLQYGFVWAQNPSDDPLTFGKLPTNGATVHATFWWQVRGVWFSRAYEFTASPE